MQGKAIVNSISLKNGEEEFVREAQLCRKHGAAVVVMAFDEQGQADSLERRRQVCRRAYDILTQQVGFPAEDVQRYSESAWPSSSKAITTTAAPYLRHSRAWETNSSSPLFSEIELTIALPCTHLRPA